MCRWLVLLLSAALAACNTDPSPIGDLLDPDHSDEPPLSHQAFGNVQPQHVRDVEYHGALEAYEAGKRFYYSKRGQLNFACAAIHFARVTSF